jgi:glycosyltransferase involved in cell wall biosynthesis
MKLTIAIPTYNRNEILCKNIASLLPQLNEDCELIILDNFSDIPVELTLSSLFEKYPQIQKRIIRHKANIGCVANILRCFEIGNSPWVWVLGDDDVPQGDCIQTIQNCLSKEVAVITFTEKRHPDLEDDSGQGVESFINKVGFPVSSLISTNVYNVEIIRKHLSPAYHFCTSDFPHLILTISALSKNPQIFWKSCNTPIVECVPPVETGWNTILVATGLPLIINSSESEKEKRIVSKGVIELCNRVFKPHSLIAQFSVSEWQGKGSLSAFRQYRSLVNGLFQFEGFSILYLKWLFYSPLALSPKGVRLLHKIKWRLSKRRPHPIANRDRI